MGNSDFFWSGHFENRTPHQKRRPNRIIRTLKVSAASLLVMVAGLLVIILLFRWIPLPFSAFMLWHRIAGHPVQYSWVSADNISPDLAIAAVASEDQRFPEHWGLDFEAIADAIAENRYRSRPRGASTISQQVTKNMFLWSGRSWLRKGLETALTVTLELCWSKRRILEVYLNIAQFGPNTFGVDAASRQIFGIPPAQLDGRQSALLISVLPNPKQYRAWPPTPYISQRASEIQEQMRMLGGRAYLSAIWEWR